MSTIDSAKKYKQDILKYELYLQRLKEKKALLGSNTSPEILLEIQDIEMKLEQFRKELSEIEPSESRQQIRIYLEGSFSHISSERKAAAIDAFAAAMKVSPDIIKVYLSSEDEDGFKKPI